MEFNISLDLGNVVQWVSALGTVAAVIFSLYQAGKDTKKEKHRQKLNLESQKKNLDRTISTLKEFQSELQEKQKAFDDIKENKKTQASFTDPVEKFYYSTTFFTMIAGILKEHYCYEEVSQIELLSGKIFEDNNEHIHRNWNAYAKEINDPLKRLEEIKVEIENKIKNY